MPYSSVDRLKMASWLDELKSPLRVQRRWRREFRSTGSQNPPDVKTIKNALDLAHEVGLAKRSILGCTRSAHFPDNVEEVVCHFTERSRLSTRRAGLELDMSYQSIIRIFERGFYPYRLRRRHAMNEADHEACVLFAMDVLEMLGKELQMLNNIIFADEAHFSLNGHTNTWNSRYWNLDNPDFSEEMLLHSCTVSVSRVGRACGLTAEIRATKIRMMDWWLMSSSRPARRVDSRDLSVKWQTTSSTSSRE